MSYTLKSMFFDPMFMDPSGGLKYHWTAYRRRNGPWAPHQRAVRQLLTDWGPRGCARLVLIGPSAGYSLPAEFFTQFRLIRVLEPDRMARILLTRRFPRVRFEFIDRPRDLMNRLDGQDAVLFCNMLGQLSLSPAMELPDVRAEFKQLAARVELLCTWASFHDRLSADFESVASPSEWLKLDPHAQKHSVSRLDVDTLATHFLQPMKVAYEHDAEEWFPALLKGHSFRYWLWGLRADQHHVIEATYSAK